MRGNAHCTGSEDPHKCRPHSADLLKYRFLSGTRSLAARIRLAVYIIFLIITNILRFCECWRIGEINIFYSDIMLFKTPTNYKLVHIYNKV